MKQFDFWEGFNEYINDTESTINSRKANPQHWYDLSIGSSKAFISLAMDTQKSFITCGLFIPDSKELYDKLYENKAQIESELNFALDWRELPNKKASRIVLQNNDFDFSDISNWKSYYSWLLKKTEVMKKVFLKYIK